LSARPAVLHLIKGLGIGGAERLISEGSRYWDHKAFAHRVAFLLPWKDQLAAEIEERGIPVDCLGSRRGIGPATPFRVRRFVAETDTSLVHLHSPGIAAWTRLLVRAPIVYTEHNLVDSYHPVTRLTNRATYPLNVATVAVSDAVAASVAASGAARPRVIHNGVGAAVTEEQTEAARNELGLGGDDPLVVHVGNIRPGKGHDNLVRGARLALDDRPDTMFVSIGVEKHPGALEGLLTDAADLGQQMRFLGRRADAWAFIAAADVFVNPSQVEGLPVALLEAMALGTPVVATRAGGVPEVIDDGDTGLLVGVDDPESLAAAVNTVLGDPVLAGRLAKGARRLVEDEYSLDEMVRAYEDLYRGVLDG
jgi:glycosyltransferase involved in cell wall biosynthesis